MLCAAMLFYRSVANSIILGISDICANLLSLDIVIAGDKTFCFLLLLLYRIEIQTIDVLLMKTMNYLKCNQMLYHQKFVNGWHQHLQDNWLQRVNVPKKNQNFVPLRMQYVLVYLLIEFIGVYQVQRCYNFHPMLLKC